MKRYLLFLVLSFFAMVLPVSADERNSQTITLEECLYQHGLLGPLPYEIKVENNIVTITVVDDEAVGETLNVYNLLTKVVFSKKITTEGQTVKVTLKKGIYLVNFANLTRKVIISAE